MDLSSIRQNNARVLVIDDEPGFTDALKMLLESHKFTILAANSGKDGLEIAHAEEPDVIILDLMMPTMNGHEVARHLKGNERTRDIPIIILTACGVTWDAEKEAHIKRAKDIGAVMFLTKPYIAADVIDGIKLAVEWRKRHKA